ncbi:hypothetical protein QBC38DRAFT_126124 [Podospora fimiseda]|uniref:Uncharacterized protein n=1 Tax=Podospora fimiseda TaxID=252190 RepID=A0AAN6YNX6_9PEZI|nr:hypothetical protein QBC38DRAFT_126124 [Podospora fimiseda]
MSTFGKNMIGKKPEIAAMAAEACGKANNAIDQATKDAGKAVGDAANTVEQAGKDIVKNLPKLPFKREADPGIGDALGEGLGKAGDVFGDVASGACNAGAQAAEKIAAFGIDAVNKVGGSVAKALGVKEYYAVHIGSLCEGEYKPAFNNPEAEVEVQECTPKFSVARTDLSKALDQELGVGPFKFRLNEIGLIDKIQDVLDMIPRLLAAMGFFFLFATIFFSFGFLGTIAIVATESKSNTLQKYVLFGTIGFTGLAWGMTGLGTVLITYAAEKIKKEVNENGEKFGMSASTSPGLYFLMWTACVLSTIAVGSLAYAYWVGRHPSGARSGIDEGLDEQKNIARGQYPIMQGSGYPPAGEVGGAAGSRESYYPDEQVNGGAHTGWDAGRQSREYQYEK